MSKPGTAQRTCKDALLIDGADTLSRRYPVWLCDVWGVVHDGVTASRAACRALIRHRQAGGTVILITNAPRPSTAILPQLDQFEVPRDCYDAMVSSGDVTRHLIAGRSGQNIFHLGPDKDLALLDGLPVNFTARDSADAVLCSGLMDDDREDPESYREMLAEMRRQDLPMICANPDRVVRKGQRLVPCAGALADIYEELGGTVQMAGKPYAPIYDECLRQAACRTGAQPPLDSVLAIGDGLPTDVRGAADYGIDLLFVVEGIHEHELDGKDTTALLQRIHATAPHARLAGIMTGLRWSGENHRTKM